ncbi:MAG: ribonuclease P protein component [Filomicrobium sp.]
MARARHDPPIATLKKRSDFLRVRGGARWGAASFALEARLREGVPDLSGLGVDETEAGQSQGARFGFTITKKIGNAVARNRIRRRFREAVREIAPNRARDDCDYVLIARRAALTQKFAQLLEDLQTAFERVHATLDGRPIARRRRSGRLPGRGSVQR